MSGVTHAHHPVRQQVLRDLPPRRSPLMSFVIRSCAAWSRRTVEL